MVLSSILFAGLASALAARQASASVNQATCNGKRYTYEELAGYGAIPSDARDRFGDTIGGLGSAISIPRASWKKLPDGSYSGFLWATPDRGWNTQGSDCRQCRSLKGLGLQSIGTINYQNRIHQYLINLKPNSSASVADPPLLTSTSNTSTPSCLPTQSVCPRRA